MDVSWQPQIGLFLEHFQRISGDDQNDVGNGTVVARGRSASTRSK